MSPQSLHSSFPVFGRYSQLLNFILGFVDVIPGFLGHYLQFLDVFFIFCTFRCFSFFFDVNIHFRRYSRFLNVIRPFFNLGVIPLDVILGENFRHYFLTFFFVTSCTTFVTNFKRSRLGSFPLFQHPTPPFPPQRIIPPPSPPPSWSCSCYYQCIHWIRLLWVSRQCRQLTNLKYLPRSWLFAEASQSKQNSYFQ